MSEFEGLLMDNRHEIHNIKREKQMKNLLAESLGLLGYTHGAEPTFC
jgi:hypothetical protein